MRNPGRIGGPTAEEQNSKGRSMRSRQARRSAVTDMGWVYGANSARVNGQIATASDRAAASADDAPGDGEAPWLDPRAGDGLAPNSARYRH